MTLKTRLFGKKVKGESLKKLLEDMGENTNVLQTHLKRWSTGKVKGRYTSTFATDGIEIDLYIFNEDIYDVNRAISADNPRNKSVTEASAMKMLSGESSHRKGKIPYSAIKQGDK